MREELAANRPFFFQTGHRSKRWFRVLRGTNVMTTTPIIFRSIINTSFRSTKPVPVLFFQITRYHRSSPQSTAVGAGWVSGRGISGSISGRGIISAPAMGLSLSTSAGAPRIATNSTPAPTRR